MKSKWAAEKLGNDRLNWLEASPYVNGIRLVNVAPYSFSQFEPNRDANYSIFRWDGEWQVERRSLKYAHHQEWKAILSSDMPGKEIAASFYEQ